MPEPLDVVVATVGHSDVPPPDWPDEEPLELGVHDHPRYGKIPRLRQYGQRALKRLRRGAVQQRADRVRLPLLDPVLKHVAKAGGAPPAVLLVATDQPEDSDFHPGDTINLAEFTKTVLEHRSDRRAGTVDVLGVRADPSDFSAVFQELTHDGLLVERVRSYRPEPPVRVGLATTGGPSALTVVVTLVLLAAASRDHAANGRMEVTELRLDREWQKIRPRGLVDVAGALGLGSCCVGSHAGTPTHG